MDKEKNWEQEQERAEEVDAETDYTGYSEAKSDLDIELKAGEWQNLSRFKTYRQRSRQGKIIATHQAVSNRLNQLEVLYYKLVSNNPEKGAMMLSEIKKLRIVQDILLQCIAWSGDSNSRQDIDKKLLSIKDSVPVEVWSLIK